MLRYFLALWWVSWVKRIISWPNEHVDSDTATFRFPVYCTQFQNDQQIARTISNRPGKKREYFLEDLDNREYVTSHAVIKT